MSKLEYSVGNLKIGADTIIINLGSATNCPSGVSGQCDLFRTNKCYAMKAEKMYPATLPYRERQMDYWYSHTADEIAAEIKTATSRKTKVPIKFVRWNESGDIRSADDLVKMCDIAKALTSLTFYSYTHNKVAVDDFLASGGALPKNFVLNLSNFSRPGFNSFNVDDTYKVASLKKDWKAYREHARETVGHGRTCIGDCSKCALCKVKHGKDILVPLH